ncbi:hypothetical protein GGI00_000941 [Coemansia sp. RSA 2681]|nr:hypothetical protein GGI00_000941 [Coemansia sp. RSA 2681]
MLPGKGIRKLSSHVRSRLNTLKRRKRSYGDDADEQQEGEGDDVETEVSVLKHPPMRFDIVHPHTYESGISDQTAVRIPQLRASPPMNYWLNDNNSDNNSDSDSDSSAHTINGRFTPQRPAPQPIPIAKGNNFSRKEWQERADGAMFGSHRRRQGNKPDDSPVLPRSEFLQPTYSLPSISLSSSASSSDMKKRWDSGMGYNYSSKPLQERDGRGSVSLDTYQKCVAALNELLFATNAQIDEEVQALIRHHLNGQSLTPFMSVFEGIVDQSFADFSIAARSILAVADHANARPPFDSTSNLHSPTPGKVTDATQSLLAGIVSSYMGLSIAEALDKPYKPSAQQQFGRNLDPLSAGSLERLLQSFDINVVKYSKEQMRLFAITGLTKYVTNQVLLSTGIENDLIDKLEEAAEALALTMDQIEILDSLNGPDKRRRNTVDCEDVAALRMRAAQYKDTVDRIQHEAKESGCTRRIYESILAEIQSLT